MNILEFMARKIFYQHVTDFSYSDTSLHRFKSQLFTMLVTYFADSRPIAFPIFKYSPEQSWVLQYLMPGGRSEYLHLEDSRRMFSLASLSRHLIVRRCIPEPQFLLHCKMTK